MTHKETIKAFLLKSLLPVTTTILLFYIFKSACMKNGSVDYFLLWLICGLPFGIHRMFLWIIPGGRSFGSSIAVFALNFLISAVIGGFVLVWRLLVAVWYVSLTLFRIITKHDNSQ